MSAVTNTVRLRDLAIFVRSKNAGPFMLTLDFFFRDAADCERVAQSGVLSAEGVARVYGVPADSVAIIPVPQASAIKVSFPRVLPAGDIGDCDVAGGQQFVPLLDLPV